MAILKSQDFNSLAAVSSRNNYIVDGHGQQSKNEYIMDGHGLSGMCAGYNCFPDPDLASQQMLVARAKYYAQHTKTKGTNKQKKPVELTQFYLSFTEDEKLTEQQMMEIAEELIERTDLKEYVCFYAPHLNTDNYHVHISVGAYQKDGKRKLAMNTKKMYSYRAELDRIVAARGLSIVEPTAAMKHHEKEYASWFEENRERLTILPRREGEKQSERLLYKMAKDREREKQEIEARERLHKQLYRKYYIRNPRQDSVPLLMVKLALAMAGLYTPEVPYYQYQNGSIKRDWEAQRRMDAIAYARESGIHSAGGFYEQKQAIGQRMNDIKKAMYQLEQKTDNLHTSWEIYLTWSEAVLHEDKQKAEDCRLKLRVLGYETEEELYRLYDRMEIYGQQYFLLKDKLDEEKKAYRKTMKAIKTVENGMHEHLLDRGYKAPENRRKSLDSMIRKAERPEESYRVLKRTLSR